MSAEDIVKTQFKPGQSGNPKGKPKGAKSWSTLYKKALKYKVDATDPRTGTARRMTLQEVVVLSMVQQAAKGNVKAAALITDRMEGKAVQPVSGPDGEAIPMTPPQIIFQAVDPEPESADA